MNTPPSDTELESKIFGRWSSENGPGSSLWFFERDHRFTVTITDGSGGRTGSWGYWDVRDGKLRIGTSPEQTDDSAIGFSTDDAFALRSADGNLAQFRRMPGVVLA